MATGNGRERAIQELRESEELHRATLSNISDAVFLTHDDGAFTFICPNVDVIFGYVPDEVRMLEKIDGLLGGDLFDRGELAARGEIRNILVVNAMDAMEQFDASERHVLLRTSRRADAIEVVVVDRGHGIAAEHMPRLFEAFFTTRQQGLGLGLAIARSIVEAHNGRISAESHDGRGATLRVALPTARD